MRKKFLQIIILSTVIGSLASLHPTWAGFSDDPDRPNKKKNEQVTRAYNDDCQKASRLKCILFPKCLWLLTKENKKGSGCFGQDYFNDNIDDIQNKYVKAPLILKNCEGTNRPNDCKNAVNCYWDELNPTSMKKSFCFSK